MFNNDIIISRTPGTIVLNLRKINVIYVAELNKKMTTTIITVPISSELNILGYILQGKVTSAIDYQNNTNFSHLGLCSIGSEYDRRSILDTLRRMGRSIRLLVS